VDDVVTALLLAATSDRAAGERFLVTGPEYPTWREFVGTFERMLNVQRTVSLSEAEALRVWRQSRHRAWLGVELLRVLREDRALRRRLLATREGIVVRRIAERLVPASVLARARGPQPRDTESPPDAEPPLAPVRPWAVRFVARTARVRIDKARSVLGYEPVFRLADGMRLTSDWARWAGLLS
jgi:nucleoside-diphosphate-sugar epimerase